VLARIRGDPALDGIPVVMCTVRAGAADRARGYGQGADAYEAKPFDLDQLLKTVQRLAAMGLDQLRERRAAHAAGASGEV
jgi:CheY-like chemotaxis protein